MVLEKRPESMIIIGSGAIGTEFAYIYNSFGTRVTLIEALPRMLPNEDDDSCMTLERAFKKQGIKVMTGASVESVTETCDGQVRASVKNSKGQEEEITADVCLVAIGVKPVVPAAPGLDLELTEKGFIKVNDRYATSLPGVYAAGDVIGGVLLAHTASFEAVQVVEGMFNPDYQPRQVGFFPSCTYCYPQVASVGKTERALKEAGVEYKVGKSLPGHWQGCSRRRTGRFRKNPVRRQKRRTPGRPHRGAGSHGADCRAGHRHSGGTDGRGHPCHHFRPSHAV